VIIGRYRKEKSEWGEKKENGVWGTLERGCKI
jgi:hypothetical protein